MQRGVDERTIEPEQVPPGTSVVKYSATDNNGNKSTASTSITVVLPVPDTRAPAFPAPPDIVVKSSSSTSVSYGDLLIWDNYDPSPSLACSPESGSSFGPGLGRVDCTVSDNAGNQRHRVFYVLVEASSATRTSLYENRFASDLGSVYIKERTWSDNGRVCRGADMKPSSNTSVYSLSHSQESGGTAHLRYTTECWSGFTGAAASFSVVPGTATSTLAASFDYRSLADLRGLLHINHVNNMEFIVYDSEGCLLDIGKPVTGREAGVVYLDDTGWGHVEALVPQIGPATCPCEIYVYTRDLWADIWKKQLYIDNLVLELVPPAPVASAPGAPQVPDPPNLLTVDELFAMKNYEDTRVVIVEKRAHDDSVLVSWDHEDWARDYKVIIHPVGERSDRFADIASGGQDSYRFVNLEPGTEYVATVGERGDDSTQASVKIRTTEAGTHPYDPGLYLSARQDGDTVRLSWTDINDTGSQRYRVERSVDGGPFEEIDRQPGTATEARDRTEPGGQVSYRVFEWVGKQKLYSDAVPLAR